MCMGRFTLVHSCWHQNYGCAAGCASPFSHAPERPEDGMAYPLLGELNHDFHGFRRTKPLTFLLEEPNHEIIIQFPLSKPDYFRNKAKPSKTPLYLQHIYMFIN